MSDSYDFVVTSGGIGPTLVFWGSEEFLLTISSHDDITYQSIAKAFGLPLKLHQEAYGKMKKFSKPHPSQPNFSWDEESPAKKAKLRMIELPTDESRDDKSQVIFPVDNLWVPVACINGNVHICKNSSLLQTEYLLLGSTRCSAIQCQDYRKTADELAISARGPSTV
jgi:hypothetical protein